MIGCSKLSGRACAAATMLALAGCGGSQNLFKTADVKSIDQAIGVYVSAYPAVAWSDVRDKLEPKNNLTIDQARSLAVPVTQVQVSQFLSSLAVGLGIGLATKSESATKATSGGVSTTADTRTTASGAIPTSSGVASTAIGPTTLESDLSKSPAVLGIDGNTLLTAGTALYQQGQILDNQISKGILPKGYQAHLVTLQINLQPKLRNISYDAYTDVSFLPDNWTTALNTSVEPDGLPPIIVYPLVIMDALEATNVGRSVEHIRQAALSLTGVIANLGINLGASGSTASTNSVIGLDKNTLVTVGRVSDHTVSIRLAAENSGSAGFALVPRSYNVSLVVLTRWDTKTTEKRVKKLQAVSYTTLISVKDGKPIGTSTERRREVLAGRVAGIVKAFGLQPVSRSCADPYGGSLVTTEIKTLFPPDAPTKAFRELSKEELAIEAPLNLLRAVGRGDYKHVATCLNMTSEKSDLNLAQELTLRRLLAALSDIQRSSPYSIFQVALRGLPDPTIPDPRQLVLYSTDDTRTSFTLRGGRGLNPNEIQAALLVQAAEKEEAVPAGLMLPPSAITLTGDGSEITISFPSLGKSKLAPAKLGTPNCTRERPDRAVGALLLAVDGATPGDCVDNKMSASYAIREIPAADKPAGNPVRASAAVLVADASGTARLTLQTGRFPMSGQRTIPLLLTVDGADVATNGVPGGTTLSNRGITLTASSVMTITLTNLTPAQPVTLTTTTDEESPRPLGKPIVLTVDRAAAGQK